MWWDNETDGELMYPREQQEPDGRGVCRRSQMSNPDEAAARGTVGRSGVPGARLRAEPADPAHAVRRFPRPRLGRSAPSSRRTARATCSITRATSSARPRPSSSWPRWSPPTPRRAASTASSRDVHAGASDGHPPGKRHALRRLPLLPGRPRQHEAVRRSAGGDRDPVHRLPRHRHASGPRCARRARRAAGSPSRRTSRAATTWRLLRTPLEPAAVRVARRRELIQRSMVEKDLGWEVVQTADTIDPDPSALQPPRRTWPRPCGWAATGEFLWGDLPRRRSRQCLAHCNQQHELHRLPLVVEPELLRLPPAAEGQQEGAAPAQRGRRHAQLHGLQLPDAARRRVHAGPRRQRDGQPHRPGPLVVRHSRRLVQQQPRVDLRPAADDLRPTACPASPSARTCRTPSAAARREARCRRESTTAAQARAKPRCAPIATSPSTTTTTPSWPSC